MIRKYLFFGTVALMLHLLFFFFSWRSCIRAVPVDEKEPVTAVFRMVDLASIVPPTVVPKVMPSPEKNKPTTEAPVTLQNEIINDTLAEDTVIATPESVQIESVVVSPESVDEFYPAGEVSQLPSLPLHILRQRLRYPEEARRRGIEGIVYLQLSINALGVVEKAEILREKPDASCGFGLAAQNALIGLKGSPARRGGKAVGVIFRYPVRFVLE